MANDINKEDPHYKGEFGSIYEVNRKFPTGGVAGDFVVIEGWAHYWNADRGTWCVNAERDSYWDELMTNILEKFRLIKGATYMGVANVGTVPVKVVGAKMYYFATAPGKYANFGDIVVPQGINVLYTEDGKSWVCSSLLEVAQEFGVSEWKVVSQKLLKKTQDLINAELEKKANAEEVDKSLKELQNTVFPLQVSLSLDKTLLEFTGTDQTVKASYSIKRKDAAITPTSLALSINGVMKDIDIKASDTISIEINKEGESTVVLTAKYDELVKSAMAKMVMVLPIFFGFGTSEVDVPIAGNKLGPRTSAAGVYDKTSTKDNVNFIILVPKTLPKLNNFTMGGAPFVMETTSVTINGKDYYMYKSGAIYMNGATLNVQAN